MITMQSVCHIVGLDLDEDYTCRQIDITLEEFSKPLLSKNNIVDYLGELLYSSKSKRLKDIEGAICFQIILSINDEEIFSICIDSPKPDYLISEKYQKYNAWKEFVALPSGANFIPVIMSFIDLYDYELTYIDFPDTVIKFSIGRGDEYTNPDLYIKSYYPQCFWIKYENQWYKINKQFSSIGEICDYFRDTNVHDPESMLEVILNLI